MRKLLLPILVFALVLSSCTDDLTSLNDDPKGASDVPGDPLFANALVELGTFNTTPNYNINMFKFMSQYWSATTYADESQYNLSGRSIPSNLWSKLYRDVLNDLERARTLIEEDGPLNEAQKANQLAMIEVVKVMTYYELVTIFGNIPYSEALDAENSSPAYDDQETIYYDLLDRLDTAIGNLDANAPSFGGSDVYYGGDVGKWVKFANSLKMRMGITLADYDAGTAQTVIEEASPNAFDSNADNLALNFTNTPPHTNPIWESLVQSGRNDFVPSNTLIDMMNNLNDPRRPIQFTLYDTDGDDVPDSYVGGPYGASNQYSQFSHIIGPLIQPDFEGIMLGYDEVELIRAEAIARGWNADHPSDASLLTAEDHYNEAIAADMQYWSEASAEEDITPTEISDYQTNEAPYPVTGSEEDQLKAIATQKWLGLYPQGLQSWTEWRRLDHPTWYTADNPAADNEDEIPSRFIYPVDEQNLNQSNWEAASSAIGGDETGTYLFWDTTPATSVN